MFETGFSQDRFPAVPTSVIKKRIAKGVVRRNTPYTSPASLLPPPKVWPVIVTGSFPADLVSFDDLKGKTIIKAFELGKIGIQRMHNLLPESRDRLN